MFADSHAHLNFPKFSSDLDAVMQTATEAAVVHILSVATRLAEVESVLSICARYSNVLASAGIHPHYAGEAPDYAVEDLIAVCRHPQIVAVGETGFDLFYNRSAKDMQELVFRNHVRAAIALNLPLVIHSRDAEVETRKVMVEEGARQCGGVIHCFTGSEAMAHWALEMGFFISFSGILTFRTATDLKKIAKIVPLERILLETDAPYLAPVPYRGQRNQPAYVVNVAQTLAELRGISLAEVAQATTSNYKRLFRVDVPLSRGADVLVYPIGQGLYINLSRGCTLHCGYCPKWTAPVVHDYDLTLKSNPKVHEIMAAIEAMGAWQTRYAEIVFCGFGEPTLRLDVLLAVAREIKSCSSIPIRINTDGLANRVYGQDITPRFKGLVDSVSVSLTAQNEAVYNRHCRPALQGSYLAMLAFIRAVRHWVPQVVATAIEGLDGVDIEACRRIAEDELGVVFRKRSLDRIG